MKIKYVKIIILIIAFSALFLLNTKKILAAEKTDYIIVGDSRTVGIYNSITGSSAGNSVDTTKKVNGKNVRFLAESGVGYDYWFNNSTNYSKITNALANAKNGSKCFIWLGINGNISDSYATKYANALEVLAKKYPSVKIYFCSITGIYSPEYDKYYAKMDNAKITNFNNKIKSLISGKSRSNLYYMDVANKSVKIGSETKTVNNWVINSSEHASDGLHYDSALYKAIWEQAMTSNTGSGTSSKSSGYSGSGSGSSSQSSSGGIVSGDSREEVEYKDVLADIDYYSDVGDISNNDQNKVENTTGKILAVITNIGIVLSIIVPALIGIKYMISGKMEPKKDLVPYFIGGAILFSICITTKIIQLLGNGINSI